MHTRAEYKDVTEWTAHVKLAKQASLTVQFICGRVMLEKVDCDRSFLKSDFVGIICEREGKEGEKVEALGVASV